MGTPAKKCTIQSTLHLTYNISIYHQISAYIIISVMIFGYIQLSNDNCSCTTSDQATIFHQNCPKTDQTRSWSPSIIRSHQVERKDANQPPKPTNSIRGIPSICQPHHVSMNKQESINNQHAWCLFRRSIQWKAPNYPLYWTLFKHIQPLALNSVLSALSLESILLLSLVASQIFFTSICSQVQKINYSSNFMKVKPSSVKETMALEIPNTNSPHRYVWGVNTQSNFKKS